MNFSENYNNLLWFSIIISIISITLVVKLAMTIRYYRQGIEENHRLQGELTKTVVELQETRNHLVHTEKMASLGELVAGVAHEINTPIGNSITTISHLEVKTCEFSNKFSNGQIKKSDLEFFLDSCQQVTKIIVTNLERAAELVRSFKKIAVDQAVGERRQFELHEYMKDVLLSLNPQVKKKNHKVILNCPSSIKVWGYPGAIWQIISNLLNNSLLHAYEEEDEGTISIEISQENGIIRLEYKDDGKGMTTEVQEKVFEPFFTTKRGTGGSGLGMHIVYNLVVFKMGGSIECTSEVGTGTSFVVNFPNAVQSGGGNQNGR